MHCNSAHLVSLHIAPPILHSTNHFLDSEFFDLLACIYNVCMDDVLLCMHSLIYGVLLIIFILAC